MNNTEGSMIATALARQVRDGAPATQIAGAVGNTWRHAEQCLAPVIGPRGVAALYKRSLFLTARSYAWLADEHEGVESSVDLTKLISALSARDSGEAAQAGGELLQTFYGLVAGLIGPSLTQRLLRFTWQTFESQDGGPCHE